jgi:hypothetical protein
MKEHTSRPAVRQMYTQFRLAKRHDDTILPPALFWDVFAHGAFCLRQSLLPTNWGATKRIQTVFTSLALGHYEKDRPIRKQ